jgi:hypothetical protein
MITLNVILNFVKTHFKSITMAIFGLFLLYWILFFLTPKIQMDVESKQKIDSLTTFVKNIENEQKVLDDKIDGYGQDINNVENNITKIKSQKETIREIYHEQINSVNTYNDAQLDSFFTNRYGY